MSVALAVFSAAMEAPLRRALLQGRRRNAPSLTAAWRWRGGVVAPRLPFAYVTLTDGSPRAALVYMVYAHATYIL